MLNVLTPRFGRVSASRWLGAMLNVLKSHDFSAICTQNRPEMLKMKGSEENLSFFLLNCEIFYYICTDFSQFTRQQERRMRPMPSGR